MGNFLSQEIDFEKSSQDFEIKMSEYSDFKNNMKEFIEQTEIKKEANFFFQQTSREKEKFESHFFEIKTWYENFLKQFKILKKFQECMEEQTFLTIKNEKELKEKINKRDELVLELRKFLLELEKFEFKKKFYQNKNEINKFFSNSEVFYL